MKRFFAVFLFVLFLFLAVSLVSFSPEEGSGAFVFPQSQAVRNLCSFPGASSASFLLNALGYGAYVLLVPLIFGAIFYTCNGSLEHFPARVFGFGLILGAICAFLAFLGEHDTSVLAVGPGGYVGATLKFSANQYFSESGYCIFFGSIFLAGLVLTCDYVILRVFLWCCGIMPIGNTFIEKLKGEQAQHQNTEEVFEKTDMAIPSDPVEIFATEDLVDENHFAAENLAVVLTPQDDLPNMSGDQISEDVDLKKNIDGTTPSVSLVPLSDGNVARQRETGPDIDLQNEKPASRNPFASPVKEKYFPKFEVPFEKFEYEDEKEFSDESPAEEPLYEQTQSGEHDHVSATIDAAKEGETINVENSDLIQTDPTLKEKIQTCESLSANTTLEPIYETTFSNYTGYGEVVCSDYPNFAETVCHFLVVDNSCNANSDSAREIGVVSKSTISVEAPAAERPQEFLKLVIEMSEESGNKDTEEYDNGKDEKISFLEEDFHEPIEEMFVEEELPDEKYADNDFVTEEYFDEQEYHEQSLQEQDELQEQQEYHCEETQQISLHENYDDYQLPDVELLTPAIPFNYEIFENTVKTQAKQLEKAFADFRLNIRVVEIQTGPVIAQFEIRLEPGLQLKRITSLTDDIAIALKVPSVRIVAPIPGKNTVGVEIPNENRQIVRLREVLEETTEVAKTMDIPIFLGKDVSGSPLVVDLTELTHLLIAGRTGTGKSVCLNSIIMSILMTRTPAEVRMILIDPKMVELLPYKTIPHLMHPVVTDMKKAEAILGWAVEKMEQRYQLLARAGVNHLSKYNQLSEKELFERLQPESEEEWNTLPHTLPYLIIIADELADLIMTATKEVETHIIRLAQKSRAVGIHLILATQKPTVDVITGLIKSNLPSRIAFGVASRSDSQVILDTGGAEKLLGKGDMLFLKPSTSQVLRGQGAYVSSQEVETITDAIGTEQQEFVEELVSLQIDEDDELQEEAACGEADVFYNKCVEQVTREGRGSASLLQRRFSIGYSRATRMIERMEKDGVVGPYNGSQAREVLISLHEWKKRYNESRRSESQRNNDERDESGTGDEFESVTKKQNPINPTAIPRANYSKRNHVKAIAASKNDR